ncbi:50S ribosomal protein L21 [soil metagenome]
MYAIFENGSHQYRVREGDKLDIDRQPGEDGDELTFEKILLIAGNDGDPLIGAPIVEGARVTGTIVRQYRQKKIIIQKFKRRKGYRRKRGHRQYMTTVQITGIAAP